AGETTLHWSQGRTLREQSQGEILQPDRERAQAFDRREFQMGSPCPGHRAHHAARGRGRSVMKFWRRREESLDNELLDYINRETQLNIEAGMAAEDARFAAQRKLGATALVKEDTRAAWGLTWIERLWQDL